MKRDARAPVIHLLTLPQAADRLGLTHADVDRLVETGDLHAVNVSPHGGRRFWPADVGSYARAQADSRTASPSIADLAAALRSDPTVPDASPTVAPKQVQEPPHRARTLLELLPQHPRWPRFEVAPERPASNYLAFRDAEHVTAYLRARATLDLDSSHSVHTEPTRGLRELVPA